MVPGRVRLALRALPPSELKVVLCADGSADLQRFIGVVGRVRWEEVPVWQNERSIGIRRDFFPGRLSNAGNYVGFHAAICAVVSERDAKRRRAGGYPDETPFSKTRARDSEFGAPEVPRPTFEEVLGGVLSKCPD